MNINDKLLIVSWDMYPTYGGSGVIVSNIAEVFSQDELVLFGEPTLGTDLPAWPEKKPQIIESKPKTFLGEKGKRYTKWLSINKTIERIQQIVLSESITKILCVFPHEYYLYASYKVAKKMNLPLYTWFHNTYVENRTGLFKWFAKKFQPKVFEFATINFVMSDGMRLLYEERYPDSEFHTLVHGFKFPNFKFEPFSILQENKISFVFTGSLNESCREATVRLLKTIIKNPNYHVHLYTGSPKPLFEQYGISGPNVHFEGFILLSDLYKKLKEYDIMLLSHGFDGTWSQIEYDTIFPTRTIPYLVVGKPILLHSPKTAFLTKFFKEHQCAFVIDKKSEQDILDTIKIISEDKEQVEQAIRNALKTSEMFDAKNVGTRLKKMINFNLNS